MRKAVPWIEVGIGIVSLGIVASSLGYSFSDLELFLLGLLLPIMRKLAAFFGELGITIEQTIGSIRESTRLV